MRSSSNSALKATTFLAFAASASAFWRMPCLTRSGLARIDPLMDYNSLSPHAHVIHGGSGFSATSDTAELLDSECTSCQVSQDKSAYWTPALYFQNQATGEFSLVQQVGGMLSYYLLYPNAGETNVTAFPEGFQMIAGDTNQRSFSYPVPDLPKSNWNQAPYNTQDFLRQAALGFNCLDYSKTPEGSLYRHFMPDKAYLDANCKDGVRFELMFPSCWNGKDKTSKDFKSHVAYPSQVMTGDCPKGFETRLVSLFYETIWNTHEFAGTAGQFMLANGDPTGFGYHGDFIMGWDNAFLQKAANQCTNPSGRIQDCELFDIQSSAEYSSCNITDVPSAILKENVVGGMKTLPGNPPIVSSGYASAGSVAVSIGVSAKPSTTAPASVTSAAFTSSIIPTLSYQAGSSISSGSQYAPGGVFAAKSGGELSASTAKGAGVTIPTTSSAAAVTSAPVASSPSSSQSFFSTQYQTNGQTVSEVLWVEEVATVTAGAPATTPASRKRHLHKHRRSGF